ncbi:MAG: UDP-glucose 4-epimerase GalE [Campylobacterales bacterium]|nr:UDP-glucose 4-epimerase GalE [Campylobacterales bacterium]MBN2832050.1 UDP-glucose 4-epimerase GalE [Campylobacterales bacterium]
MKILVTGGAGYIGSHTCVELINAGFNLLVYDNFSNSSRQTLKSVEKIVGQEIPYIIGDVRDEAALENALIGCDAVIHFAGLKSVGESVVKPLSYYDTNVYGTLCLLRAMQKLQIKKLVFSSSATVYGNPEFLPFTEKHPLRATNPYGETKLVVEEMLRDLYVSDSTWAIMILRYFNPIGAHESGLIGEDPKGIPNNLMPFIAQVAVGKREKVSVFGDDYPTKDGTGVRDYIHVVDLAIGHVKALQVLNKTQCTAINLGAGKGYSVLDIIGAFNKVCGKDLPYVIMPRRSGDIAEFYSDPSLAKEMLCWEAKRTIDDMCQSMWNFQIKNFKGHEV